ncbi:MAG TPA: formate/nitrite transporter family protein [Gemmatimonadaceae bacterium]|nr:formate/nitrite transporter family protein [Gemmatimonadaceae bacterium]
MTLPRTAVRPALGPPVGVRPYNARRVITESTITPLSEPPESDPAPRRTADRPAARPERRDATDQATSEGPAVGTRLTAREIHENVRRTAQQELDRPVAALWWSSLAAGLAISFSFLGAAFLTMLVPPRFDDPVAAAAYPIGFIFVVLARNQLFTENTLEPVIPLLNNWNMKTLGQVLRLWAVVLLGNLIGACIIGVLLALTPVVPLDFRQAMLAYGLHGVEGGFWLTGYRAIFAGWLVALLAWLVASTRATGAQIVLIWLTTAPISAFGFKHSIAGSVEAFFVAASGGVSWGGAIGSFVVPAVLGNVVGGIILVALVNHGQVAADIAMAEEEDSKRRWRWSGYPGGRR